MIAEIHYLDLGSRCIVHLPDAEPTLCGSKSTAYAILTDRGTVTHDRTFRRHKMMIERYLIATEPTKEVTMDSTHDDWITVTVPERFFWDHQNRDLVTLSGEAGRNPDTNRAVYPYVIKETPKKVTVRLHPDDAADLFNDAEHYSNASMFDWELQGLVSSARATVYQMKKQLGW